MEWQPGVTLDEMEKKAIQTALRFYGNKPRTAQALGIAPRTLDYKLAKYADEEKSKLANQQAATQAAKDQLERHRNGNGSKAEEAEARETSIPSSEGLSVQSDSETESEPAMPVRKRKKV